MDAEGYRVFLAKINELQELEARERTELQRITTECEALTITLQKGASGRGLVLV